MEAQFVQRRYEEYMKTNVKAAPLDDTPPEHNLDEPEPASDLSHKIRDKFDHFIGHFKHAHDWLRDNQYIQRGYRVNFNTPKKVLKSLFMLHNESVNVWTHLAGAIVLMVICIFLIGKAVDSGSLGIKQYVGQEVDEYFQSIYAKLPKFGSDESHIVEQSPNDQMEFSPKKESNIGQVEQSLENLSKAVENIKTTLSPDLLKIYLNELRDQFEHLPETYVHFKASFSSHLEEDIKRLHKLYTKLEDNVKELEDHLISLADSPEWDWIDFYKYINHKSHETSPRHLTDPQHLSRWPIFVFLLSAFACLICSAIFHLFFCISDHVNNVLKRLDYAGISLLITGSTFPGLVYGFYCEPFYYKLYTSIVGFASLIVFFVSLGDWIHRAEQATLKAIMYGGLGIFAVVPLTHLLFYSSSGVPGTIDILSTLPYYALMGASYLGGLTIYSTRCPERHKPGKYDICGHSHQFWHLFVLLGIFWTYLFSFDHYYTRKDAACSI